MCADDRNTLSRGLSLEPLTFARTRTWRRWRGVNALRNLRRIQIAPQQHLPALPSHAVTWPCRPYPLCVELARRRSGFLCLCMAQADARAEFVPPPRQPAACLCRKRIGVCFRRERMTRRLEGSCARGARILLTGRDRPPPAPLDTRRPESRGRACLRW